MTRRCDNGVTLIELCFGLAVVAILAGLAAPGFRASLRATAVRAAAYELMAGVQQARADAITTSRPGLLCPTDSRGNCLGAAIAAHAWRSLPDGPAAPGTGAGAIHLLDAGVTLRASRAPLRFRPGSLSATPSTLTICDTQHVAAPRAIVVSQTGRARFAAPDIAECA